MADTVATRPTASSRDRARQATVTLAEVACVLGTLVGTGVLGTPVAETAGGALSADATLLAPAGTAFSIWSVIYLGLAAYTVWQWLPGRATDPRLRATGWLVAVSMLLNAGWLLVTQQGWVWASVAVIVALLAVLAVLVRRLVARPADGLADRVVLDGTFGLYLGWVAVATCANTAAALASSSLSVGSALRQAAAVAALALVVLAGALAARRYGTRWAVALAAAWGLAWIAAGRLGDEPASTVTGVAAALGAISLIGIAALARGPRMTP